MIQKDFVLTNRMFVVEIYYYLLLMMLGTAEILEFQLIDYLKVVNVMVIEIDYIVNYEDPKNIKNRTVYIKTLKSKLTSINGFMLRYGKVDIN